MYNLHYLHIRTTKALVESILMTSTKSSTKQKLADPRPKITEEDGHYLVVGGQCSECDYSMITAPPLCPRCGNSTMKEETFGPLIAVTSFNSDMEAIDLVNRSVFGLGVSIFTEDYERAKALIPQFEDGAVFVNDLVKSDPRLPFGGTKESGYGRELSSHGIKEFLNRKTVYINKYE